MGTPASVGINDDLPSGQACVSVGSSDDEASRGVQVEDGLVVKVLGWDNGLDHMLHQVSADLLVGHILIVLGGDEDGVHALGDERSGALGVTLVLDGDLARPNKIQASAEGTDVDQKSSGHVKVAWILCNSRHQPGSFRRA